MNRSSTRLDYPLHRSFWGCRDSATLELWWPAHTLLIGEWSIKIDPGLPYWRMTSDGCTINSKEPRIWAIQSNILRLGSPSCRIIGAIGVGWSAVLASMPASRERKNKHCCSSTRRFCNDFIFMGSPRALRSQWEWTNRPYAAGDAWPAGSAFDPEEEKGPICARHMATMSALSHGISHRLQIEGPSSESDFLQAESAWCSNQTSAHPRHGFHTGTKPGQSTWSTPTTFESGRSKNWTGSSARFWECGLDPSWRVLPGLCRDGEPGGPRAEDPGHHHGADYLMDYVYCHLDRRAEHHSGAQSRRKHMPVRRILPPVHCWRTDATGRLALLAFKACSFGMQRPPLSGEGDFGTDSAIELADSTPVWQVPDRLTCLFGQAALGGLSVLPGRPPPGADRGLHRLHGLAWHHCGQGEGQHCGEAGEGLLVPQHFTGLDHCIPRRSTLWDLVQGPCCPCCRTWQHTT